MTTDFEKEVPSRKIVQMEFGCPSCSSKLFYAVPNESSIMCAEHSCAQICSLVVYTCSHCCPSGFRDCPICRDGTETGKGCFINS